MRIRSALTDGDAARRGRGSAGWMGRGGSPRGPAGGPFGGAGGGPGGRYLMRLILMLVLVVLVMQRAGDPEIYQRFFRALGAPIGEAPGDASAASTQPSTHVGPVALVIEQRGETGANPPAAVGTPSAEKAPLVATVEALGPEGRERLTRHLARLRRNDGETPEEFEVLAAMLASAAVESGEIDPAVLRRAVDPVSGPAEETGAGDAAEQGETVRRRLQRALDASYVRDVSDATVWQPEDAIPFYRLLERSATGSITDIVGDGPIEVGFASLADSGAYRGRTVALHGRAVMVRLLEAEDNPFGVENYYLVWVRPSDGSERPVMAYTAEVPPSIASLADAELNVEGPEVRVQGTYLRRHLYRSQKGSELAPVIVGQVSPLANASRGVSTAVAGAGDLEDSGATAPVVPVVVTAAVFGVGFAVFVAWTSARSGRRRRELRRHTLENPRPYLGVLGEPGGDAERTDP